MERYEAILSELGRVNIIARKIGRNLPPNVGLEELKGEGMIGLIKGVDGFDPSKASLGTYAGIKIRGRCAIISEELTR